MLFKFNDLWIYNFNFEFYTSLGKYLIITI